MKFNPLVVVTDLKTIIPMGWAILRRQYKMPWGTLILGILCLAYVLSPVDLLPDVLPILGITDDGAFIVLVMTLLHNDLVAFRQNQQEKKHIIEAEVIKTDEADKK